jgi:hypothetical protein
MEHAFLHESKMGGAVKQVLALSASMMFANVRRQSLVTVAM